MLDFIHPNLLALFSAIFIAFARAMQRYAVSRMSVYAAGLIMGMVTTTIGWAFYWAEGGLERIPLSGVFWFMAVGFFGAGCGRYLYLNSIRFVGLARSTIVGQTAMVWSAAMAVGFLGERMSLSVALGTMAIMVGAILLVYKEKEEVRQRVPLYYYLLPALSALMYAFAHLTAKFAFAWIPSAAFGMAISNTTSLTLMLIVLPFAQQGQLRQVDRKGLLSILAGALVQSFGILFFWSAVKFGSLTQVVPLSRLSILLIIFLSWLLFREQESVTWRIVFGAFLALVGAFAVAGGF